MKKRATWNTTWAGENQTQAGEQEILENSPQSGRSPAQSGRVGVSGASTMLNNVFKIRSGGGGGAPPVFWSPEIA